MNRQFSTRAFIRVLSFSMALLLVMLGVVLQSRAETRRVRIMLENTYARSLGELSANLSNIALDLEKSRYVGTPAQLVHLAARVWRESGSAKNALSTLPMGELHLDTAYRFLSQAGDYAMAISKKVGAGTPLTPEEERNAELLRIYSGELRDYVDRVLQKATTGALKLSTVTAEEGGTHDGISGGFSDLEQAMVGYPTLIYDGPFSDHLLSKKPLMTQEVASISEKKAREIAATATRLRPEELVKQDDENSNMPSYTFGADGVSVGVTKAGGYVTYAMNDRAIGEERLRSDAIFQRAERYLEELGLKEMRATYYEKVDGICIINYASSKGDVILYTDLVKVGVAVDDGGIVFYDARGYLSNHQEREFEAASLTKVQAAKSVSDRLNVQNTRLALIPTSGQNEVLTYEFQCTAKDNPQQQILVYVNAQTGAEENILIIISTPYGKMTK